MISLRPCRCGKNTRQQNDGGKNYREGGSLATRGFPVCSCRPSSTGGELSSKPRSTFLTPRPPFPPHPHVLAHLILSILLKMAQPALALSMLQELGLAQAVYAPPEHLVPPLHDGGLDWPRGTAVARAAARLLAFRSTLSEVGAPKTGAVEGCAPVVGSMEGADNQGGASGPMSEKAGTGVNPTSAPTCDGTQESGESHKKGGEKAHATEASKEDRERTGGKEGPGDVKEKQAPSTLLRELFLCAALLPLTGVKHKNKKGKLVSAAQSVVSDSLKVPLVL